MGRGQHVYRAAVLKTVPFPAGELSGTHERITELVKHTMTDRLGSRERRNLLSEIDKLVATLFGVM